MLAGNIEHVCNVEHYGIKYEVVRVPGYPRRIVDGRRFRCLVRHPMLRIDVSEHVPVTEYEALLALALNRDEGPVVWRMRSLRFVGAVA